MRAGGRFSGGRRAESRLSRSRFSGSGASFILDRFTGAAAAYSLRKLSKSTTNVVRVRRESDNDETDFTAEQINSGTLLDFTGTGVSAAGYVPLWYDQSGNASHATQTTAASQPKIVDGGVLVTENGKAALYFDGVDDGLVSTLNINPSTNPSISSFTLLRPYGTNDFHEVWGHDNGGFDRTIRIRSGNYEHFSGIDSPDIGEPSGLQDIVYGEYSETLFSGGINGELTVHDASVSNGEGLNTTGIGIRQDGNNPFEGTFSEIIFYPSDQSANRADIEADIADYYGITLA